MSKRVLVFLPKFPIISETFIEREITKLVEFGNLNITVLSLEKGDKKLSDVLEGVTVFRRLGLRDCFFGAFYLITKFQAIVKLFFSVGWMNIYLFLKSVGYSYIFSEYTPDIIYAHFLSEPSSIAMMAATVLDVPFAISAHARDVFENSQFVPQKVKKSKFIAVCNKKARKEIIDRSEGEKTTNIHLIQHGVTVGSTEDRAPLQGNKYILHVGRMVEKKGTRFLIEAFAMLRKKGIRQRLIIVGDGKLRKDLEKMVSKFGLVSVVDFVGAVSAIEYMRNADIFVLPSVDVESGDSEGIPNTLVEAAMLRVPIVTTHAGSISDFLTKEDAVIANQLDVSGIAEGVEKLLNDKEYRDAVTNSAYDKAVDMFDIERNVKKIERLLLD